MRPIAPVLSYAKKVAPVLRVMLSCTAGAAIDLESPTGGWSHSGQHDRLSEVTAAYPKPPVDRGGPEIFSMAAPLSGTYMIYVNYWGNFDPAGYNFDGTRREKPVITTMVSNITNENTIHEKRETYVTPLRKIGDLTFVKALRY